jgi:nucleoside-diphosphate-sugar epimerase
METLAANSVGLQNALNFADAVKAHLVFASTSEVYGASAHKQQSEEQWGCVNSYGPRSCYQEAKRFGEALIYSHNKRKGSKHGLVRIFNTYGPHMNPEDGRVVINFLIQARRKEALTVYGNGQQTRSFCYITDLIEGLNIYSKKSMATPVNLGNPEEMTVLALTEVIASLFPERQIEVAHKELPQEDPVQRCPDITRAFQLLDGWKPQVPLREGLKLMNAWLEESAR